MNRLLHYLLLAAVLVGLPLGCAWIGGKTEMLADVAAFPPRGDEWMRMPERLWAVRCPFNWGMFALFCAITAGAVAPFLWRMLKGVKSGGAISFKSDLEIAFPLAGQHNRKGDSVGLSTPTPNIYTFPSWGYLALAVMIAGWLLAWTRFSWFAAFQRYPYILQWGGFIFLMNALCIVRCGRSPFTERPRQYLLLFPISSLFWWFFEYLNRYVWNWFYIGVAGISKTEYAVLATICFSSVLPGVVAVAAWLNTFGPFQDRHYTCLVKIDIRAKSSLVILAALSLFGLTGIVFIPQYAYPFLWISPLMVFVLVQVILKEKSVLDVLKYGSWGFVFRFATAALICGFVWETWNYYSYAKWIYNVPWVSRFHIWEMPLVGFAGYLPFGIECAAVAHWLSSHLVRHEPI